MNRVIQTKPKP